MKSQTKILVKVGNSSDIKFSHAKAYRAITVEELEYNIKNLDDLHIVVVENILDEEEEQIKTLLSSFISQSNENKVFFYVKDNDDTTCGIADELGLDIYLTLNELHVALYNIMGINVSTNIDFRKTIVDDNGVEDDIFGSFTMDLGIEDEEQKEIAETIKQVVQESTIQSESNDKEENKKISLSKPVEIADDSNNGHAGIVQEKIVDTTENKKEPKVIITKEPDKEKHSGNEIFIPNEANIALEAEVAKLKKIIVSLENEKNTVVKAYKNLVSSGSVIEEPIGLAEYSQLKDDKDRALRYSEELKESVKELENTIAKLKGKNSDDERIIEQLRDELNEFKIKYDELQSRVESGEISAEVVKEAQNKIHKLEARMAPLNETIKNANRTIAELSDKLDKADIQIDFEVGSRLQIMEILHNVASDYKHSFEEVKQLKADLEKAQSDYEKLRNQSARKDETIAEQSKKIIELSSSEAAVESKINLAIAEEKSKVEELKTEKTQVEQKLKLVENQLRIKEEQYNEVIKNGVGSLNSDSLESINKTLKVANEKMQKQLMDLQGKYAQLENRSRTAVSNYKALEDQNKNLQGIINSSIGGSGEVKLPMIAYTGKAKIYPVYGIGSFGISTTAASLVNRLQGRTLFIDMDLAAPKGDVWFQTYPGTTGIPGIGEGLRSTAMSIFFELGFDKFRQFYDNIVKTKIKTKSGSTDCLYGTYAKPSTQKIMKADIQGLLNFLGGLYDNIVIDMGKIGSSEVTDQLIRIITNISERAFFITPSNKLDIQNLALPKLKILGIHSSKIIWIVNMSKTTSIDRQLVDQIKPAKVYIIPLEVNLIMSGNTFIQNPMTKGKFSLILEDMGVLGK